ncbi:NACHT domain-containing protein [Leptolyngbya sp. AN03gr2]|uniref:NACHT domain-containing protein n=1 Tax=unclassified Leptolyngbya TaxID=2650499 RepID=UPI003D322706
MSRRYDNRGRDQIPIENVHGDVYVGEVRSRKRPDREMTWLKAFEKEIEGRLASSLHNRILINLGKETQPEQVHRLWDMEVKSGQITGTISPKTEISEVFDRPEIAGKLLILGKPGAGKTTTLLELARALVRSAIDDPNEPMPFLLNLSSWKDPKQSIKDWAIAELTTKGIGSKIGAKWFEDQKMLPLLDGLDEVRSDLQSACVKAINQWMSDEGQPSAIVVCSRREEYELYPERLNLNGAIYLQELSDRQIESYLIQVDRALLWQVLAMNLDLLDLVRQPLFLSITLMAYQDETIQQWHIPKSTSKWLPHLLDAYIERMLHRTTKDKAHYVGKKTPTPKQTRHWLIILAKQLQQEAKTEFLLEEMQASWLGTERSARQMRIVTLSINWLLFGVIPGVGIGVNHALLFGPVLGFTVGLLTIIGMGLNILICRFVSLQRGNNSQQFNTEFYNITEPDKVLIKISSTNIVKLPSSQQETVHFARSVITGLFTGVFIGLLCGAIIGVCLGLVALVCLALRTTAFIGFSDILTSSRNAVFLSSVLGLTGGVVYGLTTNTKILTAPNQGVWLALKSSVFIATSLSLLSCFIAPVVFAGIEASTGSAEVYIEVIAQALLLSPFVFSLSFVLSGGTACIKHFSLCLVLFFNRSIPWNYARFLNYATDRMFLQRIGGRYRFIHKLLQDHFAQMGE